MCTGNASTLFRGLRLAYWRMVRVFYALEQGDLTSGGRMTFTQLNTRGTCAWNPGGAALFAGLIFRSVRWAQPSHEFQVVTAKEREVWRKAQIPPPIGAWFPHVDPGAGSFVLRGSRLEMFPSSEDLPSGWEIIDGLPSRLRSGVPFNSGQCVCFLCTSGLFTGSVLLHFIFCLITANHQMLLDFV